MFTKEELESMAKCMSYWLKSNYDVIEPEEEKVPTPPPPPSSPGVLKLKPIRKLLKSVVHVVKDGRQQEAYSPDHFEPFGEPDSKIQSTLPSPVPALGYNLTIPDLKEDKNLAAILDKRNIFTTKRVRENLNFVSDDPQENADINSQDWDRLKNLTSDRDRRKFAMLEFGNARPADPTQNLGYFGFLRSRKQHSNDVVDGPIRLENGRRIEMPESGGPSCSLSLSRKRKASEDLLSDMPPKKKSKMIPISEFRDSLENIVVGHKSKTMKARDLKYFVRHLRLNAEETTSFYKFTSENDKDSVPLEELNKSDSIEALYGQFAKFYGLQMGEKCKDCAYEEGHDVIHSM